MTTNDDTEFRPLPQRDTPPPQDVLFDGVPDHLRRPLAEWIARYLDNDRLNLVQQIALRLRLPLETPDTQGLVDAGSAFRVDWRERCLRRRVDATSATDQQHSSQLSDVPMARGQPRSYPATRHPAPDTPGQDRAA